jgi:Asparagine synthase
MLFLLDRRSGRHELHHENGESAAQALLRNGIPPTSVIVYRDADEACIPDNASLMTRETYTARLIEGYDIAGIRGLYAGELNMWPTPEGLPRSFLARWLAVSPQGALRMERLHLDGESAARNTEQTVHGTIDHFSLLPEGSLVVLGLSGGVDSGSLLMLLSKYRDRAADKGIRIHAATFQDFDSRYSQTFDFATVLARRFQVEHHLLDPGNAEHAFNLTRPIAQILMLLMETEDAHLAMYVDHHTTRRVLEVFADDVGASTIALGLHTTDLLAGLLNSWTTGYEIGGIPVREVGNYRYVFPLAFTPKRDLHLFYAAELGHLPKQTTPNQWEFNPTDRNFYYYVADHLQWLWPGIQHWMFTANACNRDPAPVFKSCENCGGSARQVSSAPAWSGMCDVCLLLDKYGWIRG